MNRAVGSDFQLADWKQVSGYYQELARESENVQLYSAGKTTEGREFLYAAISAQQNLQRLAELRQYAKQIADPRSSSPEQLQQAVQKGRPILFITPSMHSDEPASTEMAMQLAWELATSQQAPWPSIRESLVVVLLPSLNPDGVDHVVNWYRQNLGSPQEGSEQLELYQYYTGHDNNRDWFSLTQQETKLLTRLLYKEWFPQVLWDIHQYGSQKERFFVPPYRDPLNPNLDPGIVAGINALGNRAILDMTNEGLSGIACGVSYDNWWNGGNRSVPCRHHIIGLLTEAASVNIASPVFLKTSELKDPLGRSTYQNSNQFITPWPGGWWRLSDIHAYQLSFGKSLMSSLAREPEFWLQNALSASKRTLQAGETSSPTGWIVPNDQHDLRTISRLTQLLLDTGVELHVLSQNQQIAGRRYGRGSIVISRAQPYGNYVKDLLEQKEFPAGERPYDVSGWSLGALFGLDIDEIREPLSAELVRIETPDVALRGFQPDARLKQAPEGSLSLRDLNSWSLLAEQLQQDASFVFVHSGPSAGLLIRETNPAKTIAPEHGQLLNRLPSIGLYAPWDASMDEGWMRWMLDDLHIPYQRIRNETIRSGQLKDQYDVIIIPDISSSLLNQGRDRHATQLVYSGGLAGEGILALEEFVTSGGKLIACDSSAQWLAEEWKLPVEEVTTSKAGKDFYCSGSVLRALPQQTHITTDLARQIAIMFAHGKAWELKSPKENTATPGLGPFTSCLSMPQHHMLLSGQISKPELIAGKSVWCSGQWEAGTIHLFGFRPHYRGWSQGSFQLLLRAIFLN